MVPARSTDLIGAALLTALLAGCGGSVIAPSPTDTAQEPDRSAHSTAAIPTSTPTPVPTTAPSSPPTTAPTATPSPGPTAPPSPDVTPAVAGQWVPAGTMNLARSFFAAVPLTDGTVLVVGHDNNCTPGGANGDSVEAELFDPDRGTWSPTGSLSVPRTGFTVTLLPDGSVLTVGGTSEQSWANEKPLASAERYDPSTGKWSQAAAMTMPRNLHTAALLGDGRVLVAGGNDRALKTAATSGVVLVRYDIELAGTPVDAFPPPTASADIYDPATDSWSGAAPMASPRAAASAVALDDGSVLVIGGYASWGPLSTPSCPDELATAERYVPAGG